MPGATRLDIGDHQPCDGGPAKAIPHITWDENATAAKPKDLVPYEDLRSYFSGSGRGVAPHILWDPFTGRYTQFVPANSRSKSLVDLAGGTRTNRAGSVVIQVEALFFPYCRVGTSVFPRLVDTPCEGWDELHAWVHSWGVPDVWPNGRPEDCTRNERTWETKAGWYPHKAVPENNHTDPLTWPAFPPSSLPTIDLSRLITAAKTDPAAPQGHITYKAGTNLVEAALVKLGYLAKTYAGDGSFGTATLRAYQEWQLHLYPGASTKPGGAADSIPGMDSLTKLGKKSGLFTVVA